MRDPRRLAPLLVLVAAAVPLAGCGGSDDAAPPNDLPTSAPAVWNPCDGLDRGRVERLFDTTLTLDDGTPTEPVCRFTPSTSGGPSIDANYQLVPGTLQQLMDTFTTADDTVQTLHVPKSDGARVIVHFGATSVALSGFVKNGDLVQTVNVAQPKPFDRQRLRRGMLTLLDDLASHAHSSGLTGDQSSGSATPTPHAPATP